MIAYLPIKGILIKASLIIILFLFLPISSLACQFKVTKVYDGDTLKVKGNGTEMEVRLVGIDAPETRKNNIEIGQPYNQEAKEHLEGLVLNKVVEIKGYGYLKDNLILGSVFLAGQNINLEMVQAGLAEVFRWKIPAALDLEPFFKVERAARAAKKGIWIQGDQYIRPSAWRKRQRIRSICAIILFGLCKQKQK